MITKSHLFLSFKILKISSAIIFYLDRLCNTEYTTQLLNMQSGMYQKNIKRQTVTTLQGLVLFHIQQVNLQQLYTVLITIKKKIASTLTEKFLSPNSIIPRKQPSKSRMWIHKLKHTQTHTITHTHIQSHKSFKKINIHDRTLAVRRFEYEKKQFSCLHRKYFLTLKYCHL